MTQSAHTSSPNAKKKILPASSKPSVSEKVGQKIRQIRKSHRLSIRTLAEMSGLSINTLSLIENGKTSPSVNTLQQLAESLKLPVSAFFDGGNHMTQVVYQKAGERHQITFPHGQMERLNTGAAQTNYEPLIMKLETGASSGDEPVTYPGREFIYCLEGQIIYSIGDDVYPLEPGDSLIFDSRVPHIWRNNASTRSSALMVICPEPALNSHFDFFQK